MQAFSICPTVGYFGRETMTSGKIICLHALEDGPPNILTCGVWFKSHPIFEGTNQLANVVLSFPLGISKGILYACIIYWL